MQSAKADTQLYAYKMECLCKKNKKISKKVLTNPKTYGIINTERNERGNEK